MINNYSDSRNNIDDESLYTDEDYVEDLSRDGTTGYIQKDF